MIDIHNHFLPGIDDGAPDLATAVAMARMAEAEGITHLVCTPHIQPGRFDNNFDTIAAALAEFRRGLKEAGVNLAVGSAAEVHFGLEIIQGVTEGSIPFMGRWDRKDVMLLEFPHGEVPYGAERLTQWLLEHGVLPLIAHPERNRGFIRAPKRLKAFLDQGCLLQVTASALTGRFGDGPRELCEDILREDKATFMATDSHDPQHRPPLLNEAVARTSELVNEKRALDLVVTNPWELVKVKF